MSSGTISFNSVSTSGSSNPSEGGGIFLMVGTTFTMTGGTITQNECNHYGFPIVVNGGGVCVYGGGTMLFVNSPAEKDSISGNTVTGNPMYQNVNRPSTGYVDGSGYNVSNSDW
jgi:hypothetical protein